MPADAALRQLESATLADQAYDAIRAAIISGELASRQKITERSLALQLAVSPTPVREALCRLEQDGLVQRTGVRTVQVADFDASRAQEIRLAEGALRALVAGLAATNATEAQLARMERILDEGDRQLARLLDEHADGSVRRSDLLPLLAITQEFHAALNAACNNPVLLRLLRTVEAFKLATISRDLTDEIERVGGAAASQRYHEHRAMFEAVRAGDAATAERLMTEHSAWRRGR